MSTRRKSIYAIVLLLLAIAMWWLRWERRSDAEPPVSAIPSRFKVAQVALGAEAGVDAIVVGLNPPETLNFLSKAEVLRKRQAMVERTLSLLRATYQPSEDVFGQISDGAPWWGIPGQFYYGAGQRSIEGAAEESRFILNPFLLVAAEFSEFEIQAMSEDEVATASFVCMPVQLVWMPRKALAEVDYDQECIKEKMNSPFDLIAYNARDMGLEYVYVSYAESINIDKQEKPNLPYANPQYIHRGGSCGYPGGCNNMSPMTPPIDGLRISNLPAKVMIHLWAQQPKNFPSSPDMRYVIYFR
jgi:hypothetical protein